MSSDVAVGDGTSVGELGAPSGPPVDRQAAFASGAPKMSRRVIYLTVAVILVVGLGSSLIDRFLTTGASSTHRSTHRSTVIPAVHPEPPINGKQLAAPLPQFMGLTSLKGKKAPPFALADARTGAPLSLAALHGHVVVLTFFNAACNDICPVLASELHQADGLLGAGSSVPVTFVTINTDPLDLHTTTAAVLTQPTLATLPNWHFLTGTIRHLNPVWKAYGIGITAQQSTGIASHNELLYFIAPDGRMSWSAMPFANESPKGTFTLSANETARFAQGIARYVQKLAGSS